MDAIRSWNSSYQAGHAPPYIGRRLQNHPVEYKEGVASTLRNRGEGAFEQES